MTTISWTDETWIPVTGCSPVSTGCLHCYAATMSHRLSSMGQKRYQGLTSIHTNGCRHFNGNVCCHEDQLEVPMHWRKPRRIFVCSMSDLFHPQVPFDFIDKLFAVIAMCPQHTFQVLTKRPERMSEALNDSMITFGIALAMQELDGTLMPDGPHVSVTLDDLGIAWPLKNLWLGTTAEDQAAADERIPHLLKCPAAVRFLSVEPMLEQIDLTKIPYGTLVGQRGNSPVILNALDNSVESRINMVIIGGESGPHARPFNLEWAYDLIDQCRAADVAVFVKQIGSQARLLGEPYPKQSMSDLGKRTDPKYWPKKLQVQEYPKP